MKYRAVAVGLEKDGHPIEIAGQHIGPMQEWAKMIADRRGATVLIFKSEDRLVDTVEPPKVASE